jgi:hypothetical protein
MVKANTSRLSALYMYWKARVKIELCSCIGRPTPWLSCIFSPWFLDLSSSDDARSKVCDESSFTTNDTVSSKNAMITLWRVEHQEKNTHTLWPPKCTTLNPDGRSGASSGTDASMGAKINCAYSPTLISSMVLQSFMILKTTIV